jgi:flagellar M-ring protein FliF
MNQLVRIWNSMSLTQRISLIVVPMLLAAGVYAFIRARHDGDFKSLVTSLNPEDAAAVTQKIREAGIEYRLDETGSSVLVPTAALPEARLALAGAGLPRSGRIGFELFDRSNLGASDFTEQVNYRRALEGELERTVGSLSEIEQARIHITFAKDSVFLDSREPAKATVVLKLKRAGTLRKQSVVAIANLIAGSVDGLTPESVAVIDASGHLLNQPGTPTDSTNADANLEYRRQIESELISKVNAAIEPIVGPGHFRAGVNVECDFSSTEQSDESYDSARSTLLQTQTTEESNTVMAAGGKPGTASNLPNPPAKDAGATSGVVKKTENVSYQPGKTIRKVILPKGSIHKISAAVLIDQTVQWEGTGPKAKRTLVPPSPEVIKGIHDVVAGIVGFSDVRGDQVTVESLPFESTLSTPPPPAPPPAPGKGAPPIKGFDFKQPLVIYGSVVAMLLILAAVFLLMRRGRVRIVAEDLAAEALAAGESPATIPSLEKVDAEDLLHQDIADNEVEQAQLEAEALGHIKLAANTRKSDVLVRHIRESVTHDPVAAANVLRTWVSDTEAKRT